MRGLGLGLGLGGCCVMRFALGGAILGTIRRVEVWPVATAELVKWVADPLIFSL